MAARKMATKVLTNKTCKQITDLVHAYLDDKLSRTVKRDFQQHLRVCPDCVSFLNTYKKTVGISRSLRAEEMPLKVRENILDFLRRRIRKTRASA
jgi:anti-sigma factor RsiW